MEDGGGRKEEGGGCVEWKRHRTSFYILTHPLITDLMVRFWRNDGYEST